MQAIVTTLVPISDRTSAQPAVMARSIMLYMNGNATRQEPMAFFIEIGEWVD